MEAERFFAELASRMEEARRKNRSTYQRFFAELAPRLDTARALEAELDRHLARRFNVLDYLKTDELGLSSILADLLDPDGPHGQGTLFLERFVKGLETLRDWPDLCDCRISVQVEHVIEANRRIDIYVEIGDAKAAHCLAIENKPHAEDQEKQIKDYLAHLSKRYPKRFVLIYLSPRGEGPSNSSLPLNELRENRGQFAILSYCKCDSDRGPNTHEGEVDLFEDYRLSGSLADWFRECRRICEVDRLRWFLRDAEKFCQREFGGPTMTIDRETKLVMDFLLSEPDKNLEIAHAVYKTWPTVREKICWEFLNQICCRVKEKVSTFKDDIDVKFTYEGQRSKLYCLSLYRRGWIKYGREKSDSSEHITICLEAGKTANNWYYGIKLPLSVENMTVGNKKPFEGLGGKLKECLGSGRQEPQWPWWNYVGHRQYRNWNSSTLALLYRETHKSSDNHDEAMEYFVDLLVGTGKKAIQIVDDIIDEHS